MAKITGLGGFFWKTADTAATATWFTDMLDLPTDGWGRAFPWRDRAQPEQLGYTVMGLHSTSSDYFKPSGRDFMINLRVDDLDGMIAELEAKGIEILGRQDEDYGNFAWLLDCDGVKIELWQQKGPAPA